MKRSIYTIYLRVIVFMKQLARWFIEPYEKHPRSNQFLYITAILSAGTSEYWILLGIILFKAVARLWQFGFWSLGSPLEEDQY